MQLCHGELEAFRRTVRAGQEALRSSREQGDGDEDVQPLALSRAMGATVRRLQREEQSFWR